MEEHRVLKLRVCKILLKLLVGNTQIWTLMKRRSRKMRLLKKILSLLRG